MLLISFLFHFFLGLQLYSAKKARLSFANMLLIVQILNLKIKSIIHLKIFIVIHCTLRQKQSKLLTQANQISLDFSVIWSFP